VTVRTKVLKSCDNVRAVSGIKLATEMRLIIGEKIDEKRRNPRKNVNAVVMLNRHFRVAEFCVKPQLLQAQPKPVKIKDERVQMLFIHKYSNISDPFVYVTFLPTKQLNTTYETCNLSAARLSIISEGFGSYILSLV
jgi:hypothetical protein